MIRRFEQPIDRAASMYWLLMIAKVAPRTTRELIGMKRTVTAATTISGTFVMGVLF